MSNLVSSCDTTENTEPFRYRPLSESNAEIRILLIPPKILNGIPMRINYILSHASLDAKEPFLALSYVWGDPNPPSLVNVNGQSLQITGNLAAALENLQHEDEEIAIWIDAISINQSDAVEKTAQVQLMRQIYKSAKEVIIWLGPSTPQTDATIQQIRKLGSELLDMGIWELKNMNVLEWERTEDESTEIAQTKNQILELASQNMTQSLSGEDPHPFWWIMSDLGHRTWFRRIWCIQECANAKVATFRCGQEEVDFLNYWATAFYVSIFNCKAFINPPPDMESFWKTVFLTNKLKECFPTELLGIRRKYLTASGHDLRTLLFMCHVLDGSAIRIQTTDERDRVYALLGIANDQAAKDIIADYTLSCEEAYTAAARVLLKHGHDDILSLCRMRNVCKDLPSWVPDWSAQIRKPWSTWLNEPLFNASDTSSDPMGSENSYPGQVVLKGVFVDVIADTGQVWSLGIGDDFDHATALKLFDNVKKFLSYSEKYDAEQKGEAAWRIPIGDTEVSDLTSQVKRAPTVSHMKKGYEIERLVAEQRATPEDIQSNRQSHASYICQMERMYDSRPFMSRDGHVGLCPMEAQPGDFIAIFIGARVPYIVRRTSNSDGWTLIGESHVYGIMGGEFMQKNPNIDSITLI